MKIPGLDLADRLAEYLMQFPEGPIRTAGNDLSAFNADLERLIDWVPLSFVSERSQRQRAQRLATAMREVAQEEVAKGSGLRTIR